MCTICLGTTTVRYCLACAPASVGPDAEAMSRAEVDIEDGLWTVSSRLSMRKQVIQCSPGNSQLEVRDHNRIATHVSLQAQQRIRESLIRGDKIRSRELAGEHEARVNSLCE